MGVSHTPASGSETTPGHQDLLRERGRALAAALEPILKDSRPLVWEVGCGHGHFLTAYAEAHRDRLCVGVDIAGDRIARAERKRDRAKLGNLHFLQAEARFFLQMLPPGGEIADTFVLFPDPWPKSRHHKHRVLQPEFLSELAARSRPGAGLFFRTDFAPYFADARQTILAHSDWSVSTEPWPFEFCTVFQSRAAAHESIIARRRTALISATDSGAAVPN